MNQKYSAPEADYETCWGVEHKQNKNRNEVYTSNISPHRPKRNMQARLSFQAQRRAFSRQSRFCNQTSSPFHTNLNPTLENNGHCTIRLNHNVIEQPAPQILVKRKLLPVDTT